MICDLGVIISTVWVDRYSTWGHHRWEWNMALVGTDSYPFSLLKPRPAAPKGTGLAELLLTPPQIQLTVSWAWKEERGAVATGAGMFPAALTHCLPFRRVRHPGWAQNGGWTELRRNGSGDFKGEWSMKREGSKGLPTPKTACPSDFGRFTSAGVRACLCGDHCRGYKNQQLRERMCCASEYGKSAVIFLWVHSVSVAFFCLYPKLWLHRSKAPIPIHQGTK